MLTGIELCTEALCGAEYMKRSSDLWLDDELQPTVKRQATTVVHMPLPMTKRKIMESHRLVSGILRRNRGGDAE